MFLAQYIICFAASQCMTLRDDPPVFFQTEEVCRNHAQAKIKDYIESKKYAYILVGCLPAKGNT